MSVLLVGCVLMFVFNRVRVCISLLARLALAVCGRLAVMLVNAYVYAVVLL